MRHQPLAHTAAALALLLLAVGEALPSPGDPVGSQLQVNTCTTSWQQYPAVAEGGGGFVVVWQSAGSVGTDNGFGSGYSVQAQRYDGAGAPHGCSSRTASRIAQPYRNGHSSSVAEGGRRRSIVESDVARRHRRTSAWAAMSRSKGSRVQERSSACSTTAASGGSSYVHRGSSRAARIGSLVR